MSKAKKSNESLVKERIANDLAEHKITCLHRDGLYGHWRCQKPGDWNMGFIVVTWPGSLCFTGDMGDYLFQRTPDMIAFMRGSCMSYQYAAEKCVAHDGRLRKWDEEIFKQVLKSRLREGRKFTVVRRGKSETENTKEKIREILNKYNNYGSRHDAESAMYESGLWDGSDIPNCEDYTVHFLWCLHALKWFCERVDKVSEVAVQG